MAIVIDIAVLAACAAAAVGAPDPGKPDPAKWVDLKPDLPAAAVRPTTDRLPLSDQANRGRWVRYAPMSDEFEGTRLDPLKWWDHNPSWKGRQPAWFAPSNVRVDAGCLHLTMRVEDPPTESRKDGYHTFTSAAVQSKAAVRYGYFEVRARPMRSAGSSAFWFYKVDPEEWTEIDVFEIGGGAPGFERKLFETVHVMKAANVRDHFGIGSHWPATFDLAGEWHVYGLEWDAREIQFFVDGRLVRKGPNTHWHQALWMNFDSETMPDWFGLPALSQLPSTFSVDYVRAWQKR